MYPSSWSRVKMPHRARDPGGVSAAYEYEVHRGLVPFSRQAGVMNARTDAKTTNRTRDLTR